VLFSATKKNSLFFLHGPAESSPELIAFQGIARQSRTYCERSKPGLRRNSNALPWKALVPDFVTMFTAAAECCPYCAGSALVSTLNSCIASGKGSGRIQVVVGIIVSSAIEQISKPAVQAPPATDNLHSWIIAYAGFKFAPAPTVDIPARNTKSVACLPFKGNSSTTLVIDHLPYARGSGLDQPRASLHLNLIAN